MGDQHPGIRDLVLAAGCGWTTRTRHSRCTYRRGVPVSADDAGPGVEEKYGRGPLEPRVCRLFVPGLQHQYRAVTGGYSRVVAVGEGADDGAGAHLVHNSGFARSAGREYFVSVGFAGR